MDHDTEDVPKSTAQPACPLPVLIAEDDIPLAHFLRRGLAGDRYAVDVVHDGEAALQSLSRMQYSLLILDLNLPRVDGLALMKQVRPTAPNLLIMVLTARSGVEDRIAAFETGADDYLVKPFSFQELTARTRALLRRNGAVTEGPVQVGDLVLNRTELRVERAGKRIELTGKEFAVLEYLMMNARRPVTRAMIMENVWRSSYDGSTNLVDVYIKYVRDKVDAENPTKLVRTIRGVGYVLTDN